MSAADELTQSHYHDYPSVQRRATEIINGLESEIEKHKRWERAALQFFDVCKDIGVDVRDLHSLSSRHLTDMEAAAELCLASTLLDWFRRLDAILTRKRRELAEAEKLAAQFARERREADARAGEAVLKLEEAQEAMRRLFLDAIGCISENRLETYRREYKWLGEEEE